MTADPAHPDNADDLLPDGPFPDCQDSDPARSLPIQSAEEMQAAMDEAQKKAIEILRSGCQSNSIESIGDWMIAPADQAGACEPGPESDAAHSPDFRSVHWFGRDYSFTATQAACVKVLWEAWQNQTPEVGDQTVLEKVEANSERLDHVFRLRGRAQHPAWGKMIVAGATKGSHQLAPPSL